jgi:hypothetical protein
MDGPLTQGHGLPEGQDVQAGGGTGEPEFLVKAARPIRLC